MSMFMKVVTKVSSVLAALTFTVATASVAQCCHYWFAQPEEPEELRKLINQK